ncbi:MAG TPA: HAMP domain-containing sensor histidine kinase [Pedobacter sp.]|nr:HAMP domain-containing sensor histidine kinase [Pedobacter sp.]
MSNTQPPDQKKYEDFVNMAAHELKTPVTVLKAYLQLILQQLYKDNYVNYIKTVEKMDLQLNKLLHLISDLQDGVHANSEELHCLMNDFDINESIKACCDSAKAANPNCHIDYELDENCPVLKGDHDRIEQVIHNFISNGIKYSKNDVTIKIKSLTDGNNVVVSVLDDGQGIPKDHQQKIFQQFYRIKDDKPSQPGGLGLGLFICREIISKHNGAIGVNSREGEGAEFWFSLPVKLPEKV